GLLPAGQVGCRSWTSCPTGATGKLPTAAGQWPALPGQSRTQGRFDPRLCATEIGDDHVGADAKQAFALPFIKSARTIVGFVAGDGHCQSADLFRILDFDVTIPDGEQCGPWNPALAEDAFDDDFLGETAVVVERAIDSRAEVCVKVEEGRLAPDVLLVRAAGEVKAESACAKQLQELPRTEHEQLVRLNSAGLKTLDALRNRLVEPAHGV